MATVTETIDQLKNNDAIKKLKHIFEGREREVANFYASNQDLKPPTDLMEESAKSFISEEHHDKMDILADVFDLRTAGDFQRTRPPELFNVGGGIDEAFVRSILYRSLEAKGIPFQHQLTRDHIKKNTLPKWQKYKKDRLASSNGSNGHPVNGSSANGVNGKKVVEETKPVADTVRQPEEKKETAPLLQDENQSENVHAETHLNGSSQVPSAEPANDTGEDQNDEKEIQSSAPSNMETEDDNDDQPQGDTMTNKNEETTIISGTTSNTSHATPEQSDKKPKYYEMKLADFDYGSKSIPEKLVAVGLLTIGDITSLTFEELDKKLTDIREISVISFVAHMREAGLTLADDSPEYIEVQHKRGEEFLQTKYKPGIIHKCQPPKKGVDGKFLDPNVMLRIGKQVKDDKNLHTLFMTSVDELVADKKLAKEIPDQCDVKPHFLGELLVMPSKFWEDEFQESKDVITRFKKDMEKIGAPLDLYDLNKKALDDEATERRKALKAKKEAEAGKKEFEKMLFGF